MTNNLLPEQGEVFYFPEFLSPEDSQLAFNRLNGETPWRSEEIVLFGRSVMQPRLFAWYSDPGLSYGYSGLKMEILPWTPFLLDLKKRVEVKCKRHFNSVLLNLYRNEKDSNGWHSDDESELGPQPFIASLSLGEERDFLMKHKIDKEKKLKLSLASGSLLTMSGDSQKYWKHCLPKRSRPLGPRINLTFREILN